MESETIQQSLDNFNIVANTLSRSLPKHGYDKDRIKKDKGVFTYGHVSVLKKEINFVPEYHSGIFRSDFAWDDPAGFALISGRKISLMQRSTMQEAISAPKVGGIVRLTSFIIKITLLI